MSSLHVRFVYRIYLSTTRVRRRRRIDYNLKSKNLVGYRQKHVGGQEQYGKVEKK